MFEEREINSFPNIWTSTGGNSQMQESTFVQIINSIHHFKESIALITLHVLRLSLSCIVHIPSTHFHASCSYFTLYLLIEFSFAL